MARTRRPSGRGSRFTSGVVSGVSLGTNPSGVTIDQYGITIDTGSIAQAELEYLDGAAGYLVGNAAAAKLLVSGVSYWAGTTVTLVTGLSSINAIVPTIINNGAGTMELVVVTSNINNNAGCASAAIRYNLGTAGSSIATVALIAPGCSIAFIALGT